MAKTLSRSTASRVFYRFISTSRLPSDLISRQSSPSLFHLVGFIPALTRFTTIRTRMDRSGGSYSPLKSGSNFSDRPPTEMAPSFPDGRDYKHWGIFMDEKKKPGGENATKQQMIDCYVQTLAKIVGSEEETKRKIYKVSCEVWFGFGCEIDEETSEKLYELPEVEFVFPDSYVDPEYKDYGAELFVNGEVVPRPSERQRKITPDVRCSVSGGNGSVEKKTTLHELYEKEGQSPWALVESGKDIESAYWELVVKDIQDACKHFEPIYDQIEAEDGYVSAEAVKFLHHIPATAPCIPSISDAIASGISVDVTLIFSIARYEAVIDAYLDGLEASGLDDLSRVTSVASFFFSRVDTLMDKMLKQIGTPEALDLRGKAAVAQTALAYKLYQKKFSGPRWEALVKKGAKKQRLLWASSSVTNPTYSDPLYVALIIGPDTVSTMPDQALEASIDRGTVKRTIDANVSEAEEIYSALEKLGIDWNKVGEQLEKEAVDYLEKRLDSLLRSLQEKAKHSQTCQPLK